EHDAHAEPGEDRRDVVDRPCAHAIDSFGAGGYGPYPTESMTSAGWVARTYQVKQDADVRFRKITRCRRGGRNGGGANGDVPKFLYRSLHGLGWVTMAEKMYSVEEVADHLGLHVRTVRGYIRTGRLKAVRIGKQYRIAQSDLDELTGRERPAVPRETGAHVEVSSIVQIDGIDQAAADRLGTFVLAGVNT